MKILMISDTHSKHRNIEIPEADTIICAGDISFRGEMDILVDFADWMSNLPIKNKITIFGNHEIGLEYGPKRETIIPYLKDNGIHYLENSGITIDGIKFWGSPVQPTFHNWEFNKNRGKDINKYWKMIPDDTEVLITHGPAYGRLDMVQLSPFEVRDPHQGCQDLLNRINQLKQLKIHCFGHLHYDGGKAIERNGVIFVNAAICTESYIPSNLPILLEI